MACVPGKVGPSKAQGIACFTAVDLPCGFAVSQVSNAHKLQIKFSLIMGALRIAAQLTLAALS